MAVVDTTVAATTAAGDVAAVDIHPGEEEGAGVHSAVTLTVDTIDRGLKGSGGRWTINTTATGLRNTSKR